MMDNQLTSNPTLVLIDSDDRFRHSLADVLVGAGYAVLPYANAHTYFADLHSLDRVDGMLLESDLSDSDGLSTVLQTRREGFVWPAILVSARATVSMTAEAMSQGIDYVFSKPPDEHDLLDVVARYREKYTLELETRQRSLERTQMLESLSPREREVLRQVACGRLNKQIANELSISVRTVESFRGRIMSKIRAESIADLVAFALATGIISNRY